MATEGTALVSGGIFRFQIGIGDAQDPRHASGGTWFGVLFSEEDLRTDLGRAGFGSVSIEMLASDTPIWKTALVTGVKG